MEAYLGVDVGTGSVRCAAFDRAGKMYGTPSSVDIKLHSPRDNFYQQSSDDIWRGVCTVVNRVLTGNNFTVMGIGFDATCSLVNLDKDFKGVSVDPENPDSEWDVILWMDHRAQAETDILNSKPAKAHRYVGGKFSPEMELPKLMWLKRHLPDRWNKIKYSFDLVDFLTFRATGDFTRSVCTLVCKWGWIPADDATGDWESEIINLTGLSELRELTVGETKFPGSPVGAGLSAKSGVELNLPVGTSIGTGLIDAHAGALGVLKTKTKNSESSNRMAIIAGTSCCHMFLVGSENVVPGVWGPYRHAILSNQYLLEGGQTTAGATIDWLLKFTGKKFEDFESDIGEVSARQQKNDLIVVTDFHGNRSPLADPTIKGSISGLGIETNPSDIFIGIMQGLALGTRHITDKIEQECKVTIDELVLTGGLAKSAIFRKINADVNQVNISEIIWMSRKNSKHFLLLI